MSALAGIWRLDGGTDPAGECVRMLAAQSGYGPDAANHWADGVAALGRNLSRSLPEDIFDRQPLVGGGGRYVLVADLRLDNRDELAIALAISAERAGTMCDAAVLLAAFERWEAGCCERLVGDYAFAVWDLAMRRLVLARDIAGLRPLHYHRSGRLFAFASMPKGLHALADVPRAPDMERAAEFLALLPEYGPRSFFAGLERVEPGGLVVVTEAGVQARRHWQWNGRRTRLAAACEYVEAARTLLDEAVRSRLRGATGAVAAHLSGGFDSSGVAATAARLLAPSGGKLVAFTAVPRAGYDLPVPPNRIVDEGPLAAMTAARHPNIEHVLVRSGGRSPLQGLDRNFYWYDRPVLNLCNGVWIDAINDEARSRGLGVLLTGHFGNLSLSYGGHELLPELLRCGAWHRWIGAVAMLRRSGHRRLRGALWSSLVPFLPSPLWRVLSRALSRRPARISEYSTVNPASVAALDLPRRARQHGLDLTYQPPSDGVKARLAVLGRVDFGNYHHGVLGGWGIDVRDPTADRRLIEFCLSVPTEEFCRDGVPRALARAVLADRVPAAVLAERRLGLQAIDWHDGLTAARDMAAEELLRVENTPAAAGILDTGRMRRLIEAWPSDGWERPEVIDRYRFALLRGLSVGHFVRRATGGNR